ncbi:helix-turn-helix domain-containing protein [Natronococcus pandeyae]|uniref:helix-turn-helix domain-containing protein n=1 Tax=Natronococcus pandeyae TaxID=2055836 RepID=UPI001F26C97F|nr:helix-turn-helix domain-containing protein [Natronococcus pandeyae]
MRADRRRPQAGRPRRASGRAGTTRGRPSSGRRAGCCSGQLYPRPRLESFRREELLSWDLDHDAGTLRFLSLVVGDPDVIDELADDLEYVRRYDLTPVDEDTFYGYAEMDHRDPDASLMGAFDVPGLVIVPPIVYTARENVHVTVLGESDAMSRLLDRFPEDIGVEVQRVSEHQRAMETLAGRLTARQFEALEVAHEERYYEVPRSGLLAAVADALECSESTVSTLLRSAEAALVEAAVAR